MGHVGAFFATTAIDHSTPASFPRQLQSIIPPLSLHEGAASFLFVLLWNVDLFRLLLLGVGDVAMLHLTINQTEIFNVVYFNNFNFSYIQPGLRIRITL